MLNHPTSSRKIEFPPPRDNLSVHINDIQTTRLPIPPAQIKNRCPNPSPSWGSRGERLPWRRVSGAVSPYQPADPTRQQLSHSRNNSGLGKNAVHELSAHTRIMLLKIPPSSRALAAAALESARLVAMAVPTMGWRICLPSRLGHISIGHLASHLITLLTASSPSLRISPFSPDADAPRPGLPMQRAGAPRPTNRQTSGFRNFGTEASARQSSELRGFPGCAACRGRV